MKLRGSTRQLTIHVAMIVTLACSLLALGGLTATSASPASVPPPSQGSSSGIKSFTLQIGDSDGPVDFADSVAADNYTAQPYKAVVIARDDFFSDALAGGPLAAAVGGPLLLSPPAPFVDPDLLTEVQSLIPAGASVYILGGDLAIAEGVDTMFATAGYHVVRVAGTDEFDTAVQIAELLGNRSTVFLTTGLNYYDAASAVPAAIQQHAEILLTDGSSMNPETAAYLSAHPPSKVYAIGGPLAAYGADPQAIPVFGQDLLQTSLAVAKTFFGQATAVGMAGTDDFAGALVGGVFMGTGALLGPVLLVNSALPLPPGMDDYLGDLPAAKSLFIFGSLSEPVLAAIQSALGWT